MNALVPTYARADLAFVKGEGVYLETAEGEKYLDFGAGVAVASLGHAHPALVSALCDQAQTLWHTSNLYSIPGQERLGQRLCEATFADQVFFANSGAEAMECAIKMARKYHAAQGDGERYRVITFEGAFHGRTLAMISAGGKVEHLEGFGPPVDGFDHVPFGNMLALRDAIGPETAAILIEPVQGEGGVRPASIDYLRGLRAVADEFGLLLIFDEVQCGMGRTGRLFAHERAGVAPDIMALAKGLGGGFPVGACMATEAAARALPAGSHGSTFGGNPLAMRAAGAVLDVMLAPGFMEHVDAIAEFLWRRVQGLVKHHPGVITEIRGAGLMMGLKCAVPNGALIEKLFAGGLLSVPASDNVVRLLPPLIVEEHHVNEALAIIDRAALELEKEGEAK